MHAKKLAIVAVALAGTLAAAAVDAHGRDDVRLSVTIGAPFVAPVRPAFAPLPVVRFEGRHDGRTHYRAPTRWDVDGDGIPNRVDRVYNPRWDRDGDGVPNRYDRFDDRRFGRDGRGPGRW